MRCGRQRRRRRRASISRSVCRSSTSRWSGASAGRPPEATVGSGAVDGGVASAASGAPGASSLTTSGAAASAGSGSAAAAAGSGAGASATAGAASGAGGASAGDAAASGAEDAAAATAASSARVGGGNDGGSAASVAREAARRAVERPAAVRSHAAVRVHACTPACATQGERRARGGPRACGRRRRSCFLLHPLSTPYTQRRARGRLPMRGGAVRQRARRRPAERGVQGLLREGGAEGASGVTQRYGPGPVGCQGEVVRGAGGG